MGMVHGVPVASPFTWDPMAAVWDNRDGSVTIRFADVKVRPFAGLVSGAPTDAYQPAAPQAFSRIVRVVEWVTVRCTTAAEAWTALQAAAKACEEIRRAGGMHAGMLSPHPGAAGAEDGA